MIEEHGHDKEAKLDFDSLEIEIDKEIDNLFVPTGQKALSAEVAPPLIAEEATGTSPIPEVTAELSPAQTEADPGSDAFELELDREIDNLFTSAKMETGAAIPEPASVPVPEPGSTKIEAASGLDSFHLELDRGIDSLFTSAKKETGATIPEPAPEPGPTKMEAESELASFHLEIDREIDNLFTPAKMETGTPIPEPTPEPSPTKIEAVSELDSFHLEIDREIDNLFIPASREKEQKETVELTPEPVIPIIPTPPSPEKTWIAPPEDLSITTGEDLFSAGAPTGFKSKYPSRAELPKMVEEFNAAYLSLDWEFSRDNIRRLEAALEDLETFAKASPGSASIFKILRAILARLSLRPQAANNRIVEMVRDCQGLLAHLLLMEGAQGSNEKERVSVLIGRFRQMREKALAAKETRQIEAETRHEPMDAVDESVNQEPLFELTQPLVEEPPVNALEDPGNSDIIPQPIHYVAEEEPQVLVSGKMPDRWSLLELKIWLESSRRLLAEKIEGADSELSRIRQIESILGKTPALSPVVERLTDIRTELERHLDALREQEGEWRKGALLVENLARISAAAATYSEEIAESLIETPIEGPVEESTEPEVAEEPLASSMPTAQTVRADICQFQYMGRPYGIPVSKVVKVQRISRRKAKEILQRRYGTLTDVKQLFRSIRTGVSGKLGSQPGKSLKSIEFDVVGPQVFQTDQAPPDPRVAIFLSDGSEHALILADSNKVDYRADTELTLEPCSCHSAMGTYNTGSGTCVEVLDLERIFLNENWSLSRL